MSGQETANSVAVLNTLLDDSPSSGSDQDGEDELQTSSIGPELSSVSAELDARWQGALFALHPKNPDAARHFCTSARELLVSILESWAPDSAIVSSGEMFERTPEGAITRRSRIRFVLGRSGIQDADLESFVEDDVKNVLTLFRDFNGATHGSAGRFNYRQLSTIKRRVEDAVRFLFRIGPLEEPPQ